MFVLFFLGTNVLLAQKKVSGIVKEADTNEPLIRTQLEIGRASCRERV